MAMLSAADVQAMIEATVRGVLSGQAQAAPPPPQPREDCGDRVGHVDERHFRRIEVRRRRVQLEGVVFPDEDRYCHG